MHPANMGILVLFLTLITGTGMWGCPRYNVWQQGLKGQAELKRAEQNRKIAVEEALALKEAAAHRAEAEVIRAGGVARAQEIINSTLTERYIQWLMAEGLADKEAEVIYVPTEAQLPVLEAMRLRPPTQ